MTVTQAPVALRDEDGAIRADFVERVARAVAAADSASLRELVGDLHEADVGDLIEALDPELRPRLVEVMGLDFDFSALTEVDDTSVRKSSTSCRPRPSPRRARSHSDDAVILEVYPRTSRRESSINCPQRAGRARATSTTGIPPAGECERLHRGQRPDWTVGRTIDHLRETPDLPDRFYEIYVVDQARHLKGAVGLDRLLRTRRPVPIADIVNEELRRVHADDDQEEVARLFERYDLISAPVVDADDRLVGVITVDDIVDVIEAEAEEDIKALGGVRGGEELSDSVWTIARGRFPWLFANLLTALLSSFVISVFQGSLEKMVALAVLMPIVASMGGNAGTQTMTVAVRALATQELSSANVGRVIRRELLVGAINGASFAVIMGMIAAAWFNVSDLGLVIALAMATVLVAAALGGILIPLLLTRLGVDPAVSSGPFVTTITDVVGFFSFLGIASLWFGLK
jgi:magnesium transporter